jgi:hypothetical protein
MKSPRNRTNGPGPHRSIIPAARIVLSTLFTATLFAACGNAPKAVKPIFYRPAGFWITGLVIIVGIPALAYGIIHLIGFLTKEPETEPERTIEEILKGDKPVLKLDFQPLAKPAPPAPKFSKAALVSAMFCGLGILSFVIFAALIRHPEQLKAECSGVYCVPSGAQVAGKFAFGFFYIFEIIACLMGLNTIFNIREPKNNLKGVSIAATAILVALVLMVFWKYFGYF